MTPPPDNSDVSVGELSRMVTNVLLRFEGLAKRLEDGQFVRSDLYNARQELVNNALQSLQDRLKRLEADKADQDQVAAIEARLAQLEDDKKWLVRLVIGFIILAVLGAIVVSGGAPK